MTKPPPQDQDELVYELTGKGVEQDSVDTAASLRMMHDYVDALVATSRLQGQTLQLIGLYVEDKCVQLKCTANNSSVVEIAASYLQRALDDEIPVPRGLTTHIERIRKSAAALGSDTRATLKLADEKKFDVIRPRGKPLPEVLWEIRGTEVHRVQVRRVGGAKCKVQLLTHYEGTISADVPSLRLARSLGPLLYEEIDATVEVVRGREGDIVSAKLVDFTELDSSDDPLGQIQGWFAAAVEKTAQLEADGINDED